MSMSYVESLLDIPRKPVGEIVAGLMDDDEQKSASAGTKLVKQAAKYGVNVRDYLTLAAEPDGDLSGYEAALAELNLPIRNDFEHGVVLQAASETFQTHPGTRALFPEVIDDVLRWKNRQDQIEQVAPLLANSRTVAQPELLSTVVDDDSDDRDSYTISEMGRIPVRSIRTSENTVKIWKHGSGIRMSYEFDRRASLELITPYASRINRELELSKVTAATDMLVNGDSVHAAANVQNQSGFDSNTSTTSTNGEINYQNLLYWLVQRAKAGVPVDTVVGNWDAAFQWAKMWSVDGSNTRASAENFAAMASQMSANGVFVPLPRFVLSSAMPASQLLGFTRGETLEELVEANSNIQESERSIQNQTITMVKTENTGYRLVYGDTREIYDYAN